MRSSNLIFKTFLLLTSLLVAFPVNAACNAIICTGKITQFYINDSTKILIEIDQDLTPLADAYQLDPNSGCAPVSRTSSFGGYVTLLDTHKRFSEIYSALLTSQLSDKEVTIRLRSGTSNCQVAYVRIR